LPHLRAWAAEGKSLAIFSSGSVKAQGLFLGHTKTLDAAEDGGERKGEDIRGLFAANFDTVNAGAKGEVESYVKIVEELGVGRAEVLFLSDNVTGTWEQVLQKYWIG
jgi:enolase-phosphatase E1